MFTMPVAETLPNRTAVVPSRPLPEMWTTLPPAVGPALGEIPYTVGANADATAGAAIAPIVAVIVNATMTHDRRSLRMNLPFRRDPSCGQLCRPAELDGYGRTGLFQR